jgi:lipopolysaccharide export system permease protein
VTILSRYILREHVGPLIFALATLTSILLLNQIAKQFGKLVGKGLGWSVIGEFFALSLPFIVAMSLPMAVLVAVLYAFSRLGAENEITALRANGVSVFRLVRPVLGAALFVAAFMLYFNDQVLPASNVRLATLQSDIARTKPTFALREQVINEVAPGRLYLRAARVDDATSALRGVTIFDLADPGRRRTIHADSGMMALAPNRQDLQLTLYNGYSQEIPLDNPAQLQRVYFGVDLVRVRNVTSDFDRTEHTVSRSEREMSICQMQEAAERRGRDLLRAERALEERLGSAAWRLATGQVRRYPAESLTVRRTLPSIYCDHVLPLFRIRSAEAAETGAPPQQPVVQQPVTQQPVVQQPVTQQPVVRQPVTQQPISQRPSNYRPLDQFPGKVRREVGVSAAKEQKLDAVRDSVAAALIEQPQAQFPEAEPLEQRYYAEESRAAAALDLSSTAAMIDMNRVQLLEARFSLSKLTLEMHKKFALAATCVVFVLIGAPVALRFPRGGVGLVIGASLAIFSVYYVGLIGGESLADKLVLNPVLAMWLANIIFTIVGAALLWQSRRVGSTARGGDMAEILDNLRVRLGRRLGRAPQPLRRASGEGRA